MNQLKRLVAILVAVLSVAALVSGCGDDDSDVGTPVEEYTKYLVQQAIDRYDAEGREAAFEYYNSAESLNGSWYVFIIEGDYLLVNPNRPDLIGTSTAARSDVNGKPYGKDIVAADEDGVWVDYFFTHPITREPTQKFSWAVRHDGLVFASGWFE
ncbi:MAG: cache domain-containing protein [Acidimicrobiaceae bacterium]|nr:cache domain-containing protein [Acidimicrobiaceae bacterium]